MSQVIRVNHAPVAHSAADKGWWLYLYGGTADVPYGGGAKEAPAHADHLVRLTYRAGKYHPDCQRFMEQVATSMPGGWGAAPSVSILHVGQWYIWEGRWSTAHDHDAARDSLGISEVEIVE